MVGCCGICMCHRELVYRQRERWECRIKFETSTTQAKIYNTVKCTRVQNRPLLLELFTFMPHPMLVGMCKQRIYSVTNSTFHHYHEKYMWVIPPLSHALSSMIVLCRCWLSLTEAPKTTQWHVYLHTVHTQCAIPFWNPFPTLTVCTGNTCSSSTDNERALGLSASKILFLLLPPLQIGADFTIGELRLLSWRCTLQLSLVWQVIPQLINLLWAMHLQLGLMHNISEQALAYNTWYGSSYAQVRGCNVIVPVGVIYSVHL